MDFIFRSLVCFRCRQKWFHPLRCRRYSWKFCFTLCIFCISLNLLFLNIYLSFLYPLLHPVDKDCAPYKKDHKEDVYFLLAEDLELNAKLTSNDKHPTHQNWFAVSNHSYVYSAYHTRCPLPMLSSSECVQFIGITLSSAESYSAIHKSTTLMSSLKCGFRNQSMVFYEGVAFVELLPESHFLPYTAAFFYCELKSMRSSETFPDYAAVYDEKPVKWLSVEKITFKEHFQQPSMSLCVRPLYGHFSKLFILQFLSYYLSEGIDQFIFYHHNVSQSTLELLTSIAHSKSIVSLTLLPWNIPLSNNDVHEYGQLAFTQDCLARSRYKYSHSILVDLDEFLVPKEHKTLVELASYLDAYYSYAGSFVVPNVMFCDEFQTRPHSSLPAIHHDRRQKTPWAYGYRSKYIAQPHKVRYGGVHSVWVLENKYHEVKVPSSLALLHHYKPCCGMRQTWFLHLFSFNVLDDEIITDDSLSRSSQVFNDTLNQLILSIKDYI